MKSFSSFRSLLILFLFGISSAVAGDYTWTGKGPDLKWSTKENWSPSDKAPGAEDTANIPSKAVGVTIDIDSAITVLNLNVTNATLSGEGSLILKQVVDPDGMALPQGNSVLANANLMPTGGVTIEGDVIIIRQDVTHPATYFNCTVINDGSIYVDAVLSIGDSGLLINRGDVNLLDGSKLDLPRRAGVSFVNEHRFSASGATVCTGSGGSIFTNSPSGNISVAVKDTLEFDSGMRLVNSGEIYTGSSSCLINILTEAAFLDGSQIGGSGSIQLLANASISGTVVNRAALSVGGLSSSPSLTFTNGLLQLAPASSLNWYAGNIEVTTSVGSGTIEIATNAEMHVDQKGFLNLFHVTVTNAGTISFTNVGTFTMGYGARIDNSWDLDFRTDGVVGTPPNGSAGYNVASINFFSDGALTKSFGSADGLLRISVPVTNLIAWCQNGNLMFSAGGSIVQLDSEGLIRLASAEFTYVGTDEVLVVANVGLVQLEQPGAKLQLTQPAAIVGKFQQLPGTTIYGDQPLTVYAFTWAGGTIAITNSSFSLRSSTEGGVITITGANNPKLLKTGTFINEGKVVWTNDNASGGINLGDAASIQNTGSFEIWCDSVMNDVASLIHPVLTNSGTFAKYGQTGSTYVGVKLVDQGIVDAAKGTLELASYLDNGAQTILIEGSLIIDNPATVRSDLSGNGQFTAKKGIEFDQGDLRIDTMNWNGAFSNNASIKLDPDPGTIHFNTAATYTQMAGGRLIVPIAGPNASKPDFGQLILDPNSSSVTLSGTLEVQIVNGYAPPLGATFPIITANHRTGVFTQTILPPGLNVKYTPVGVTLVVTGAVPVQAISPQLTSAGLFEFGFNSISGRAYRIEISSDLNSWTPLNTFTGDGLLWQLSPEPTADTRRYFRVIEP